MDKGHLLFTSAMTWCATGGEYSVGEASRIMEKEKITYGIWYVPVPQGTEYSIECFAPQVAGAYLLEMVEYKNGRKIKKQGA